MEPSNSGTNHHPDALGVLFRHYQPRVFKSLASRSDAIMDEDIHFFGFLIGNIVGDIETFDRPAYAGGEIGNIEALNGSYSAFAVNYAVPRISHIITHGGKRTHASDHDTSFTQDISSGRQYWALQKE
jgi:hypothetical protein